MATTTTPEFIRTDVTPEAIAKQYAAGSSITQLAEEFSCSTGSVRRRLQAAGVKTRGTGRPANDKQEPTRRCKPSREDHEAAAADAFARAANKAKEPIKDFARYQPTYRWHILLPGSDHETCCGEDRSDWPDTHTGTEPPEGISHVCRNCTAKYVNPDSVKIEAT